MDNARIPSSRSRTGLQAAAQELRRIVLDAGEGELIGSEEGRPPRLLSRDGQPARPPPGTGGAAQGQARAEWRILWLPAERADYRGLGQRLSRNAGHGRTGRHQAGIGPVDRSHAKGSASGPDRRPRPVQCFPEESGRDQAGCGFRRRAPPRTGMAFCSPQAYPQRLHRTDLRNQFVICAAQVPRHDGGNRRRGAPGVCSCLAGIDAARTRRNSRAISNWSKWARTTAARSGTAGRGDSIPETVSDAP